MSGDTARHARVPLTAGERTAMWEVIRAVESHVEGQLAILRSPSTAWQPADYLPDFSGEGWQEQLAALRRGASTLPDDVLVVLVGDMVTEDRKSTRLNSSH